MSKWGRYLTAAGITGLAMLLVGQVQAIEAYQQQYRVYWYGIAVGDASISLTPLGAARYQFQMQVREQVPFYEMQLDSNTIFRIEQDRMLPEQAWIKGRSEGEQHDVRFRYHDGKLAQIEGLDKAITLSPPLIDYITFVARLAFDFSRDNGIQDYTVLTERGKINQHRFAIRENGLLEGRLVHFVTELDNRNRTEMEVVANTGIIRHFTKYRNGRKRLEFIPR